MLTGDEAMGVQGLVLVGAALAAAHVALEQGALSPLSPAATRKTRAKAPSCHRIAAHPPALRRLPRTARAPLRAPCAWHTPQERQLQ